MKPGLFAIIAIGVVLLPHNALAQATKNGPAATATDTAAVSTKDTDEKQWSYSASAYVYFVPEDRNFVSPIFTADRNKLHLEARYNYENLDTASVWVGRNFSFGKNVTLDLTLMLGGVFGDTDGIAPGYEGTLRWRKLELYSEGEYVFDSNNSSDSFLYTWSELSWSPKDWFRFGLVVQRTKLYESDLDIQRGLLVGFAYKKVSFTAYVFNPDQNPRTVVLSVGGEF